MTDLVGKTFGRWAVVAYLGRIHEWHRLWLCVCSCGRSKQVLGHHLISGQSQSCGCLCRERTSAANSKHGKCKMRSYKTWKQIRERCFNRNNTGYKHYGARGITVCKRWKKFENFFEDMGERPEGLSIERINNNRSYCKSNCKWATFYEQANNKRNNVRLKFNGKILSLTQVARITGIKAWTLRRRLISGFSLNDVIAELNRP